MVLFSVIIPVFNREDLIRKTLDSVFNQSFNNYEIIVIDDGSTDNTYKILELYGDKLTVLTQQNQGPGKARNIGIENSQGKYIAFLDSDDLWFPWTLEVYNQVIQNTNYPAFLSGISILFNNEDDIKNVEKQNTKYRYYNDFYSSSKEINSFLTSSVVIHRDILQKVNGFTIQWINSEDNDLWLRLGIEKGFVFIDSPSVLAYRQHSNSAISITTKTYEGTFYLIEQEKINHYPGGKTRKKERLAILTRHIRPVSLECLRERKTQKAWKLYKESFLWHLFLGRFRYLIGFVWMMFLSQTGYLRR